MFTANPMNTALRKVNMKACKKATNNSSMVMATLPRTTGTATTNPNTALAAPAMVIKLNKTARRICPAIMLANNRIAKAKHLTTTPSISKPAIRRLIGNGPMKKCRRY